MAKPKDIEMVYWTVWLKESTKAELKVLLKETQMAATTAETKAESTAEPWDPKMADEKVNSLAEKKDE